MNETVKNIIILIVGWIAFYTVIHAIGAIGRVMEKSKFPIVNRLPAIILGLAMAVGGFVFWLSVAGGNPISELRLIMDGVTTKGVITDSEQVTYTFESPNGQTINGKDHNGTLPDNPSHIEVEYLPSDPTVNRIKGSNGNCSTITEWLWRKVGLGGLLLILFVSPGVGMIRWGIRRKPESAQ